MPMPRRRLFLLLVAALLAIGTIMMVRSSLQPAPEVAKTAPAPEIQVLVARKDLPSGSFVGGGDVEWRQWPANVPQDGLLVKDKVAETDYTGAVVRIGIRAGEPVTQGRLIKTGDRGFLSAVLTPGMRAMTVKITPQSGVAGFIFPNDYVDIILATELSVDTGGESTQKRHTSQTVLENVRVLAMDQKSDDQNKEVKTAELATLEVTPKQAEKLALVSQFSETQMGRLSLALRSIANENAVATPAKPDDTGGLDPKLVEAVSQALPAPMPKTKGQKSLTWDSDISGALPAPPSGDGGEHHVQIYRGSEVTNMTFTGSN